MSDNRLVKIALRVQYDMNMKGNMFMDVPEGISFDEIEAIASNREHWKWLHPPMHGQAKRWHYYR